MKLQKNTSLALYSVLEFAAEPDRHISSAEIADKYGVSPHHLAKVLSDLARDVIPEVVAVVADKRGPGELTPVGTALGAVLSEIDEIAKATFSSITLATMQRLIERQQRGDAESRKRTPQGRASGRASQRKATRT